MRILYSSCVLPEQGTALESSSTGGVEFLGGSCRGCVAADWNIWRRSSRGGIPIEVGREKGSMLLRECKVFWNCQPLAHLFELGKCAWNRGWIDWLRQTIPPSLPVANSFPEFLRSWLLSFFLQMLLHIYNMMRIYFLPRFTPTASFRTSRTRYSLILPGSSQYH